MSGLRTAAMRALELLERADCSTGYCCCGSHVDKHSIGDGHSPVDEGDYYQCKAIDALRAEIAHEKSLEFSLRFYKSRCDALQQWQSRMRDPERTVVCDILANGFTLDPEHGRYTAPPAKVPLIDALEQQLATVPDTSAMWAALDLIACGPRPDGTWNRDREACRLLALKALGRDKLSPCHDSEKCPR